MRLTEIANLDLCGRIAAALLCGAVIGLNRDLNRKPAGLRTFCLMALGTASLTAAFSNAVDSSVIGRVVQGVLTGVGFLGAGMIMHPSNTFEVQGLTTAASVWLAAALATLCGLGQIAFALSVLVVAIAVLALGRPIERQFERWFGPAARAGNDGTEHGANSDHAG